MNIQVLTARTTTNGVGSMARGSITTVAKANLVDAETFVLDDGPTSVTFEFDVNGTGVSGGNTAVNVSTDTTAADVRDRIITAINASALTIVASNGGAATVTLVNSVPGTDGNTTSSETVVDGGFAITNMSGAVDGFKLSTTAAGVEIRGDRCLLMVKSTAGSATMSCTLRVWGYSAVSKEWHPVGTGTDALKGTINNGVALGETSTDTIAHAEVLYGLENFERVYLEVVAISGTATAISAWVVA